MSHDPLHHHTELPTIVDPGPQIRWDGEPRQQPEWLLHEWHHKCMVATIARDRYKTPIACHQAQPWIVRCLHCGQCESQPPRAFVQYVPERFHPPGIAQQRQAGRLLT